MEKNIWKLSRLQIRVIIHCIIWRTFLPPWFCLILRMAIQRNGYYMSEQHYLKMKKQNRTEQILWEVALFRHESRFQSSLARSVVFFSTVCSLPSITSAFSLAWRELLYCLQTPLSAFLYIIYCHFSVSWTEISRFPPLLLFTVSYLLLFPQIWFWWLSIDSNIWLIWILGEL